MYYEGSLLAYSGKNDADLHLLRLAIDEGYCAVSALNKDPLLEKLRDTPKFGQLLTAVKECQNRFLAD